MRQAILDTGPLVAFFNPRDRHHTWAREQTRHLAVPLVTCEAALTGSIIIPLLQPSRMIIAAILVLAVFFVFELRRNGFKYLFSNDRSEEARRSRHTLAFSILGIIGVLLSIAVGL